MLYRRIGGVALLLVVACLAIAKPATKLYKGNWFTIRYPSAFTARKSTNDSAFFKSKDGSVEFYVFSPQWNDDPKEVALNPKMETLTTQSTQKRKVLVVKRMAYKAKDGSYFRSVEDKLNTFENTRTVFGVKYRNEKALAKWRKAYLAFKKSLVQYSD